MASTTTLIPSHSRFEVMNLETRKRYTFGLVQSKNCVEAFHTTAGSGNPMMEVTGADGKFPFDCRNAEEYFHLLYNRALSSSPEAKILFAGYVNDYFEPMPEIALHELEAAAVVRCGGDEEDEDNLEDPGDDELEELEDDEDLEEVEEAAEDDEDIEDEDEDKIEDGDFADDDDDDPDALPDPDANKRADQD